MTTVYIIDNEGSVTSLGYALPPQEAIKAYVIQEVMNIRNFVGKDIEVPLIETANGYSYPFSDNSNVWVRK